MNLLIVFVMSIESVKLMLSILYCISNVFYQVSILFVQSIMCRVCSWRQFSVFPDRLSESILILQKTPIHLFSAFFFKIKFIKLMPCFMVGLVGNDL